MRAGSGPEQLANTAAPNTDSSQCRLLSGTYASMLQVFLGVFSLSSLFYKRWIVESESASMRPYEVWLMDVSKQAVQSVFVHFGNIFLSIVFVGLHMDDNPSSSGDECAFYFLSFILDTVVGVHLIWMGLRGVRMVSTWWGWTSVTTQGSYGHPPSFSIYLKQLFCFLLATFMSKFVLGLFLYSLRAELDELGTVVFRTFKMEPATELTIVMVVCPIFLNAAQFWLLDNILAGHRSMGMGHDDSEWDLKQRGDDNSVISSSSSAAKEGVFFRVRANS